jgi:hypothetical protein
VFHIKNAYSAGLVKMKSNEFAKASIDYICYASINQSAYQLVGVEVKTRVSARQAQAQGDTRQRNSPALHCYKVVDATTPEFQQMVPSVHERVQVMHHACVFRFRFVLLLVGDINGKIIQGIWIYFPTSSLDHYLDTLKVIYRNSLDPWAYHPSADRFPAEETISSVLPPHHDYFSVKQHFGLWHKINQQKMPLPQAIRIAPLVVCKWNGSKGSSDTITKLIDESDVKLPVGDSAQATVISRMLMISAVAIHRIGQVFSANATLDYYPTLERYRKSANNRMPFQDTVEGIMQCASKQIELDDAFIPDGLPRTLSLGGVSCVRYGLDSLTLDGSFASVALHALPRMMHPGKTVLDVPWSTKITGFTPTRNARKFYVSSLTGKGAQFANKMSVQSRGKKCLGIPFAHRVDSMELTSKPSKTVHAFRGSCALCKRQVSTYCFSCHHHLCGIENNVPKPSKKDNTEGDAEENQEEFERFFCAEACVGTKEGGIVEMVARYSCYHQWHRQAWTEYYKNKKNDS